MEDILNKITLRAPETDAELDELISLWCEIFGDTRAFADDFYICSGKENTLIALLDGKIIGAINFPRITYFKDGKEHFGAYIFAAFTVPEYRGRGVFGALMSEAEVLMRARGDEFSFVVPAKKSLSSLYRRFGYDGEAYKSFPYREKREVLREYTPTDDSYILWKIYSRGVGMFKKDLDFFTFAMREAEFDGALFAAAKNGYIVYKPRYDGTIEVLDRMSAGENRTTVPAGDAAGAVYGLYKSFTGDFDALCDKPQFNMFFEPDEAEFQEE